MIDNKWICLASAGDALIFQYRRTKYPLVDVALTSRIEE